MGLRFRKSIKIAPGVKINLNKKSTSVTFGGKGIHYTVNSKGKKTASIGIPGTGLSYSESSSRRKKTQEKKRNGGTYIMSQNNYQDPEQNRKWYQKTGWIIALLFLFFPVGLFLMWKYTTWKKTLKSFITAIILILAFSGMVFPDKLESITLNANADETYDINQEVVITVTTTPGDYTLSTDDFQCSGGTLDYSNDTLSFSAIETGSYRVWAEHDGIKSNVISLKIEDKSAIAEQEKKAKEEQAAAKKAAQDEQEGQAQAATPSESQSTSQVQENNDPIVYVTQSGSKYHRDGCRHLKNSKIEKKLSEAKGSYSPCGVCNPPQ